MAKRKPAKSKAAAKSSTPENTSQQARGRDQRGHFLPGVSGNPGGRPAVAKEIRDLAQCDSPEAYQKVVAIMRNDDHKNQLPAAIAILKMAGVSLTAEAQPGVPAPPPLPAGQVPNAVALEALAGGPAGNLQ